MGILNVTPDSFWPGGRTAESEIAERAAAMLDAGADILDIGGESTRPGAAPVDADAERARVVPAIRRVRAITDTPISVDTRVPAVAAAAMEAGADWINDVSGLRDPAMIDVAAASGATVVAMHMRGDPATMQRDTTYADVVAEVRDALDAAVERAVRGGIDGDKILVDPGIGFGKSTDGNLEILRRLPELVSAGRPVLIGASRKSFLGAIADAPVEERLPGSLAIAAWATTARVAVLRVHDVAETVQVVRTIEAVLDA